MTWQAYTIAIANWTCYAVILFAAWHRARKDDWMGFAAYTGVMAICGALRWATLGWFGWSSMEYYQVYNGTALAEPVGAVVMLVWFNLSLVGKSRLKWRLMVVLLIGVALVAREVYGGFTFGWTLGLLAAQSALIKFSWMAMALTRLPKAPWLGVMAGLSVGAVMQSSAYQEILAGGETWVFQLSGLTPWLVFAGSTTRVHLCSLDSGSRAGVARHQSAAALRWAFAASRLCPTRDRPQQSRPAIGSVLRASFFSPSFTSSPETSDSKVTFPYANMAICRRDDDTRHRNHGVVARDGG